MQRKVSLAVVCGVLVSTVAAPADEFYYYKAQGAAQPGPLLVVPPAPAGLEPPPAPAAEGESSLDERLPLDGTVPLPPPVIPIFRKVRYKDRDNVHPSGVPMIVAVPDPCVPVRTCAGPSVVYIQICVPPFGTPRIKPSRNGREIEYCYGDYEVEIKIRKGYIEVDYDD